MSTLLRVNNCMADLEPDNNGTLHDQRDWLLVTLSSIGDAVITTDLAGRLTFLNHVAESLTGCTQEVVGQTIDSVIHIINEESRQPVEIPRRLSQATGFSFHLVKPLDLAALETLLVGAK